MRHQQQLRDLLAKWTAQKARDPSLTPGRFIPNDPELQCAFEALLHGHDTGGQASGAGASSSSNPDPDATTDQPPESDSLATGPFAEATPPYVADAAPRVEHPAAPGEIIGRYELRELVARGGMGAVFRAWDRAFGREVAIKVVLASGSDTEEACRRFEEEAQITGRLQHPGIPPAHELGKLADGRPFLAMKLIHGRTFRDLLRERPSPQAELAGDLQAFEAVCQTVAYAHAQGVIHRDLKPHNIMVGAFGEVQVMDWGLAKSLVVDRAGTAGPKAASVPEGLTPEATAAGTVLGTLAYMPPEQARGEIDRLDPRADVFSLGAILCEILTGRPPYQGQSASELLFLARQGQLHDAQQRLERCGADPELLDLARRCLAADRHDRPADGGAVAQAIGAYRTGVEQRLREAELQRAAATARAAEEQRRRRVQLALAGSLLVLVLAVGGGGWWIQQERSARAADEQRSLNERQIASLKNRQAAETALAQAEEALRREALGAADAAIAQAKQRLAVDGPEDLRQRLAQAQKDRDTIVKLNALREHYWCTFDGDPGRRQAKSEHAAIFAGHGISLAAGDPAAIAAMVRQSVIKERLTQGLYDWLAMVENQRDLRKLAAILNALEPNPHLDRVRNAIAERDFERVQGEVDATDPRLFPASLVISLSTLEKLKARSVIRVLHAAWERRPNDASLLFRLSNLMRPADGGKDRVAEMGYLRAVLALLPKSPGAWNDLGVANKARGNLEAAIDCYHKALKYDPHNPIIHYNLGNCLLVKGDADGARAAFQQAIKYGEDTGKAYTNLGTLLLKAGKTADAIRAFQRAVAVNPKRIEALTNLGKALTDGKDYDGALKAYRQATVVEPKSATAWAGLSYVLTQHKQHAEALDAAKKAVAADPGYGPGHLELGRSLLAKNDWKGAAAAFRASTECQPGDFSSHFALGLALNQINDPKGAAEAFRQATLIDPTSLGAHLNLASVLAVTGDKKGAMAAYRAALAVNARSFAAHLELGKLLHQSGDIDAAALELRHAVECNAQSAEAHFQLAAALLARGDLEKAQGSYRAAAQLYPAGSRGQQDAARGQERCAYLLGVAKGLPDVLEGKRMPADESEALGLVGICLAQKRYAAAVRLFQIALTRNPKIADDPGVGHRYHAAAAALLAAAGKGTDADKASEDQKRHWRSQALAWLRADLTAWRKALDADPARQAPLLAERMRHWQSDPMLAGCRQPDMLKAVAELERSEWQQLWKDVQDLRQQAERLSKRCPSSASPDRGAVPN
jgi:tetratricopeptide (TPR) repeat protein